MSAVGGSGSDSFSVTLRKAEAGDAVAMFSVAGDYKLGTGVTANLTKSKEWLTRAKAKFDGTWRGTNTQAMFEIAQLYFSGEPPQGGGTQVMVGGTTWFWRTGDSSLLPLDIPEGMKWLRRASDLGNPQAQMYLAHVLQSGATITPEHQGAEVILPAQSDQSVYAALAKRAADSGDPALMVEYANLFAKPSPERLAIFERAADSGYVWAIDDLVNSYMQGTDGTKDAAAALSWLEKGVREGHFNSAVGLANAYCQGTIVPQNPKMAVAYLRELLAAVKGDKQSTGMVTLDLARTYATCGDENGTNDERSLDLFATVSRIQPPFDWVSGDAATLVGLLGGDNSGANPTLGIQMLRLLAANAAPFGPGVEKDEVGRADKWLGDAYYSGTGVPADKLESLSWYQKAADAGDAEAMNYIGVAYANGLDGKPDFASAAKWYQKAADQDNWWGTYNLAGLYASGNGVPQDYGKAVALYRTVATRGIGMPQAMDALGNLYRDGSGVPKDYTQALEWYQKAAAQNDAEGENGVGWMYENGFGVTRDYQQALTWFQKAAALGDPNAENNLGWFCQHGLGVQPDNAQAIAWYKKAIAHGSNDAKQNLAALQQQIANQQQEAARQAAEQQQQAQQAAEEQANEAAQNQQDIQDKIDSLNNEIQQLESDASDADQNADNLATNSNCTGGFGAYAQIAQQGCENINSIGVAKFRSEAAKDRNQADDDRAEIARLQGEEVQEAPHRDASFSGALAQQMQQNPQPSIVDTANQQAANMIAVGAANDAAKAQAAARRAEQQREQQAQQQAQPTEQIAPPQHVPDLPAGCITVSESDKEEANFGAWVFTNNCGVRVSIAVTAPPDPQVTGNPYDVYQNASLDVGQSLRGPLANQRYKYFACPSPYAPYDSSTSSGHIVNPNFETNETVCLQVDASGDILAH